MKYLIPLFIILIGFAVWFFYPTDSKEKALFSGTIEADDAALGSKVGGRVIQVFVEEGDEVKKGDLLIQLDRDALQARHDEAKATQESAVQKVLELENGTRPEEIDRLKAELEATRQQLRLLSNGARPEDIEAAKANLDSTQAELRLAEKNEKRFRTLFSTKDTTAENLDRAVQNLQVSQNRVRAAEADWQRLTKGFRVEEIEAAEAQVQAASAALRLALAGPRLEQIAQAQAERDRAAAALQRIQVDLDETLIHAPLGGVIESSPLEIGDLLAPNQTALTLILHQPLWIRIYVPESQLGKVPLGKKVEITVSSQPGERLKGRVVQINRQAEFTPRNVQTPETRDHLVFGVKIQLEDPNRRLRPGMVADVYFDAERETQE